MADKNNHFSFDRPEAALREHRAELAAFGRLLPDRAEKVAHVCASFAQSRDKSDPFTYSRVMSHFRNGVVCAEDFGTTNAGILFPKQKKAA
jgi:hypothetical protein